MSDPTLVRDALTKVTLDLITRLPDGVLVTVMEVNGVVTRMESREISGQPNAVERNRRLLSCLQQKDAHTILQFFAVLKTNRDLAGYNELVESFLGTLKELKQAAVVGETPHALLFKVVLCMHMHNYAYLHSVYPFRGMYIN